MAKFIFKIPLNTWAQGASVVFKNDGEPFEVAENLAPALRSAKTLWNDEEVLVFAQVHENGKEIKFDAAPSEYTPPVEKPKAKKAEKHDEPKKKAEDK